MRSEWIGRGRKGEEEWRTSSRENTLKMGGCLWTTKWTGACDLHSETRKEKEYRREESTLITWWKRIVERMERQSGDLVHQDKTEEKREEERKRA